MTERASISVGIPTWNAGARFRVLLDALGSQELEGGFEFVIVDSGSTDGTIEAAEAAGATVHSIPQSEFNHGGTRNLLISKTSGDLVCLLTQDAVPMDAEFLANITAPYRDPHVNGVYARQFPLPDCDPILRERLRRWSASRDRSQVVCFERNDPEESRRKFDELLPMQRYQACAFDNVASSLRRSTWERHPFPERNFGEDVAWAREVLLSGGTIAFEPSARVEHSHPIAMKREFERIYRDHKNLSALFELRNVPSWRDVWKGWAWGRNFYKELLEGQDLERREYLYWRAYSVPYSLFETAAQFLGARSHWKTRSSTLWAWIDRRICSDE